MPINSKKCDNFRWGSNDRPSKRVWIDIIVKRLLFSKMLWRTHKIHTLMANSRPSFFYRVLHLKMKVVKDESLKQMISKRSISYQLLTKQEWGLNMYPLGFIYLLESKTYIFTFQSCSPFFWDRTPCRTSFFKAVILLLHAAALFLQDFN